MNTELKTGVIAVYNSGDNSQHVALTYITNEQDYISYIVASHDTDSGYTYWGQFDDKQAAVDNYNDEYSKLF